MSNQPLTKIQASTAAEVCARFDLAKDAKPLLREGMKPAEFLAALLEQKKHVDAIMFLAHALPPRESVWWGCLCMQHASGGNLLPADKAAARAAAQWVMNPTEENRAAAKAPSEAAPPPSVAGTLARAAHQSGGSVAPPGNAAPSASTLCVRCSRGDGREARLNQGRSGQYRQDAGILCPPGPGSGPRPVPVSRYVKMRNE